LNIRYLFFGFTGVVHPVVSSLILQEIL